MPYVEKKYDIRDEALDAGRKSKREFRKPRKTSRSTMKAMKRDAISNQMAVSLRGVDLHDLDEYLSKLQSDIDRYSEYSVNLIITLIVGAPIWIVITALTSEEYSLLSWALTAVVIMFIVLAIVFINHRLDAAHLKMQAVFKVVDEVTS